MNDDNHHIPFLDEARAGDRAAMGRLATLVWQRLYPFVFRTTLDRDATEDLIQETLLAMLNRLDSLRDSDRFWPWIYRVAWSKIQDRLRDRRLRCLHERSRLGAEGEETEPGSDDANPLEVQVRRETLWEISMAVARLNRQQRDVLHLRCCEDLSYIEIAERVQITPQKARVHFHRARKSLKKRLTCGV
jgi:RNA polymerase sigma-70 factor (ECF subfamily)